MAGKFARSCSSISEAHRIVFSARMAEPCGSSSSDPRAKSDCSKSNDMRKYDLISGWSAIFATMRNMGGPFSVYRCRKWLPAVLVMFSLISCSEQNKAQNLNTYIGLENNYISDTNDLIAWAKRNRKTDISDLKQQDETVYRLLQEARVKSYSPVSLEAVRGPLRDYELNLIKLGVMGYAHGTIDAP